MNHTTLPDVGSLCGDSLPLFFWNRKVAIKIMDHKNAEAALKKSLALFNDTERLAKVGGWEFDPSTNKVTWTDEVYRIFGVSKEYDPSSAEQDTHFYAPEDQRSISEAFQQAVEKGVPYDMKLAVINDQGTKLWVETVGQVERRGDEIIRVFGYIMDITERRQAKLELTASETRYRRLFESAKDGILILDAETGMIMDVNPFLIDMLGYSKEQFIDKTIWDIGAFRDIVANQDKYLELQQNEYVRYEDLPLETADGRHIQVLFVSNVYLVNEKKVIQCNIRDITQRKHTEEALRRQTERLRNWHRIDEAVLQAVESPEAIIQTTLQHLHNMLDCQRASVGIFDLEKKDVRVFAADISGDSILRTGKVLPEEAYGEMDILLEGKMEIVEDLSKKTLIPAILRTIEMEGVESFINVPLFSAQGLYGALSIGWEDSRTITPEETEIASEVADQITIAIEQAHLLQDTKRHAAELEQRVVERTAQLEAANKELEAFSYSVSHDLRAPLRAVDGYTRILLEDYESSLDDEGKRVCKVISDSARTMGKLIDDLLAFSRTGRTAIHPSAIDMATAAQSVYSELAASEDKERIDFHVALLPSAVGDPNLIRQVWTNLLSNAIKFSSKKERALIEITGDLREGEIVYSIRDNGAGFDMQYADKLFGVFQRLHSTKEFEGTGVGLAIVQRIIHRHGGRVWAEGDPDKGAAFHFTLK